MSPEIKHLAAELASHTGISVADAERGLKDNDASIIALAKSVVDLESTREEWRSDMKRHRRKIVTPA